MTIPTPTPSAEEIEHLFSEMKNSPCCEGKKHDSLEWDEIWCCMKCYYEYQDRIVSYIRSLEAQNAKLVSKVKVAEEGLVNADNVFCECRYKEGCHCYEKMQEFTGKARASLSVLDSIRSSPSING